MTDPSTLNDALTMLEAVCREARESRCIHAALERNAASIPRLSLVNGIAERNGKTELQVSDPSAQARGMAQAKQHESIGNLIAVVQLAQAIVPLAVPVLKAAGVPVSES